MSKNDPTSKHHATVTKTTSQQSTELMTPSGLLGGLNGINRPSNKSDEKNFGSGNNLGLKLPAGLNSTTLRKPSNASNSKNVGA
jgi:hypothetical protein